MPKTSEKVLTLRQRLDKWYRRKAAKNAVKKPKVGRPKMQTVTVHNNWCRCSICTFNQRQAKITPPPRVSDKVLYGSIPVENAKVGSYHLILNGILCAKKSSRKFGQMELVFNERESSFGNTVRIQPTDDLPMILLPGTLVRLDYHNPKTKKYRFTVLQNVSVLSNLRNPFDRWTDGKMKTIPLIPASIKEYPYELARERLGIAVHAVLTNPKMGYFEIDGHKTKLLYFETIMQTVLKTRMVVD
jgi:hypothetical protein